MKKRTLDTIRMINTNEVLAFFTESIKCSLVLFLLVFFACGKKIVDLPYCEMHEHDQSYVNTDKSDLQKYENDRSNRLKLIENNFELLINYSKRNGFPFVEPNLSVLDSCKYWAVTMTMLHTAQTRPEHFFSKKMSIFFKKEIDKGFLPKDLLEKCLILTTKTTTLSKDEQLDLASAAKLWSIDFK